MSQKVVLAYSGGLDTSVILKWLLEQGYDVIAYIANIGQPEDFEAAKQKALQIGASKVYVEDLRQNFVDKYIFPALASNLVYENRYLLGTSLARPIIAQKQIDIAKKEGADFVAHGATGKGNDQVRFEFAYAALCPDIKVLAPWKMSDFLEQFKGRIELLDYANQYQIPITSVTAKPYSIDENLMHISHESGILEDPAMPYPDEIYSWVTKPELAPNDPDDITLHIKAGMPVELELPDKKIIHGSLPIYQALNDIGSKHGIGKIDIVENRYVGIKSRGVYETPGGTILHTALRDIEGLCMDKEVIHVRDSLALKAAQCVYNGYWFSPEMNILLAGLKEAYKTTDGQVTLKLYKGSCWPVCRSSKQSMYSQDLASMDIEGGFDQTDALGFINVNAVRLKTYFALYPYQETIDG